MKVLILHTDFRDPGGVASYYTKLRDRFKVSVDHFIVGRRPDEKGLVAKIYRMVSDYSRFVLALKKSQYEIIHINPSLDFKAFVRDGVFLLLARFLGKKTIVFFRGWQKSFETTIKRNRLWLFKLLYGGADVFIVLSEEFKKTLKAWGCTQPIHREVTIVDDGAINGFDIREALLERLQSDSWRVLFLSRIVRTKGVYETIEAVSILQSKYPNIELVVAGDGEELEDVKSFAGNDSISNVTFTGYVTGEKKKQLLENAHIMCYPTYYGEGMPNTIIESMAFGLPIITRPVGGVKDFFKNEEHGFASTSKKPQVIADSIEKLLLNQELYSTISLNNYHYAQSNFLASDAALRLERIYESLLRNA